MDKTEPKYRRAANPDLLACQSEIWSIRDNDAFPLTTRFAAAKWSAFIESGFYPDKPLFLPDELYRNLDPDDRDRFLRLWSARRADLVLNDGMDKQLLESTRDELNAIVACVMQTDAAQAATFTGRLGRSITAHLAGAGASAGLMGLAAAVGTASTGTAIGTLSGAALVSSQLAWVGSFVGGGMAAGTLMTVGLALGVGVATAKIFSKFRIKPRQYNKLPALDKQVVDKCSWMIEAINEELERDKVNSWAVHQTVYKEHIRSLYETLNEKKELIAPSLRGEFAFRFNKHLIPQYKANVLDRYEALFNQVNLPHLLFKERSAMVMVTTVLWKLWRQECSFTTVEEELVIEALRRSNHSLADADLTELGAYVGRLEADQLKGLANNVKGIYHELRYVEQFNQANPEFIAELHPKTNQPGSDVVIRDLESGEIMEELQLKATESNHYILEHFEKYPGIPLVATIEVAEYLEGIQSSGLSDLELESDVQGVTEQLEDFGPFSEAVDAAAIGGVLGLVLYGAGSYREQLNARRAGKRALEGAGIAAITSTVVSYLFS